MEREVLVRLFDHYIEAQQALARDDATGARESLSQLAEVAPGALRELAVTASATSDLETMRKAFEHVSRRVIDLELPKGLIVASCPHGDDGDAVWLQKGGPLENPYHGPQGRDCGSVVKSDELPTS